MENLQATAFARDYHMTGEIAATQDGRITAIALPCAGRSRRLRRLRRPDQVSCWILQHLHRLVRHPGRPCDGRRRLYQQGAGRRRLSLLVPGDRGVIFHRANDRRAGAQARSRPGRNPPPQPDPKEQFPYQSALGWEYDSGDYLTALDKALNAVGYAALARRATPQSRGLRPRRDAQADGHRRQLLHRDRRRRPDQELRHSGPRHVRFMRDPGASDRQRDRAARHDQPGPGPRHHLRPDPGQRDRHSGRQHHDRRGRHRHRTLRARHLRLALDPGRRCGHGDGRPQDPRQGADDRGLPARSARRRPRMGCRPLPRQRRAGACRRP